jgi:SAM-dependent methyltransferase
MKPEFKTNLVETYNRHAHERDKYEIEPWKAQEGEHFAAILKEKQTRTVLEIGAGTGNYSQFFQERGFEVICTDGSPGMSRLCGEKGLPALVMDFYHLGFPAGRFDAVWALNCLLHVPKKELPKVLQGIKAVLKPAGLFYLGMWGGVESEGVWESDTYIPKRFFSFYSDQQLQTMVANFFEILYFKAICIEGRELRFQSIILRKTTQ